MHIIANKSRHESMVSPKLAIQDEWKIVDVMLDTAYLNFGFENHNKVMLIMLNMPSNLT